MTLESLLVPVLSVLALCGLALLWQLETGQWIEIYGTSGHRSDDLGRVLGALRRAGLPFRTRSTLSASEAAFGMGLGTTVLVKRSDVAEAQRAIATREI